MDSPNPKVLSVSLTMTPELAGELQREQGALALAQAYVIDGPEMAQEANKQLQLVKGRITRLKELKGGFIAPAKQIIANAESLFDPAIQANQQAEHHLKSALLTFQVEEERKAEEARRARDAEERRQRQEADAKAAAERARAEEQAREARRQAEEAEAARRKAEAEGNVRAAAAAAAEAAKATARADAAIENGEAKAQQAQLTAAAAQSQVEAPAPTALGGFSKRDNWVAELAVANDEEALRLIVSAVTGIEPAKFVRPDLLAGVKLDWPTWNRLAKGLKKQMSVPGLRSVNKPIAASKAA